MTSTELTAKKIGTKKESFMKHYFFMGLKRMRKFMIILSILQVIGLPLVEILATCGMKASEPKEYSVSNVFLTLALFALVLTIIFLICSVLAGITFAIQSFHYLHKKTVTDMYYSLPVSTNERFFADFFAGLISYIVPQVVGFLVTLPTTLICAKIAPNINVLFQEFGMPSAINAVIKGYILLFALMLLFYVVSCLICVLCGQFFETLVYTVVINGLLPGVIAILFFILFSNAHGVAYGNLTLNFVRMTSPVGVLIYYLSGLGQAATEAAFCNAYLAFKPLMTQIAYMLVFVAIYFALTFFLYKKRKSEDVGKPFVFRFTFYFVTFCIILCISAIGVVDAVGVYIGAAFASLVIYMIIDIITRRANYNVRGFLKSLLAGGLLVALSTCFVVICNRAEGFGAVTRIPDAEDVKSVSIEFHCYLYSDNNAVYDVINSMLGYTEFTFTDSKMVEKISNLHEDILDNYLANKERYDDDIFYIADHEISSTSSSGCISITYRLKNDLLISREYEILGDYYNVFGKYLNDRDFLDALTEQQSERENNSFIAFLPYCYYTGNASNDVSFSQPPSGELIAEVLSAVLADSKENAGWLNRDWNVWEGNKTIGEINLIGYYLPVGADCANLVRLLKEKFGVDELYLLSFTDGIEAYRKGDVNINLLDSSNISISIDGYYYQCAPGSEEAIYELCDLTKEIYAMSDEADRHNWAYENIINYGDLIIYFPDEMRDEVTAFAEKYQAEDAMFDPN